MNIYQKLQTIRVQLQKEPFKKSGQNKFAGYEYFELQDFLPRINELMLENNLCSNVSFGLDMAVLTLIDTEKPDSQIIFTSPMSEASLKGCHAVQNLGAVQTYLRRYLYVAAFEIVENDPLDKVTGNDKNQKPLEEKKQDPNLVTADQIKRMFTVGQGNTMKVKEVCLKYGYTSSKEIKKTDYDKIIKDLETAV